MGYSSIFLLIFTKEKGSVTVVTPLSTATYICNNNSNLTVNGKMGFLNTQLNINSAVLVFSNIIQDVGSVFTRHTDMK